MAFGAEKLTATTALSAMFLLSLLKGPAKTLRPASQTPCNHAQTAAGGGIRGDLISGVGSFSFPALLLRDPLLSLYGAAAGPARPLDPECACVRVCLDGCEGHQRVGFRGLGPSSCVYAIQNLLRR